MYKILSSIKKLSITNANLIMLILICIVTLDQNALEKNKL